MDQQQLSGIDASFLYLETPETPMHVAGLTYFELPDGFRGQLLPALPPLLRKPPAHHPDLLQAAGAVALRSRSSRLGRRRRPRPRLPSARDGAALARHRGAARGGDRPPARQHARSQPAALAVLHHHRPGERPGRALLQGPSRRGRRRRRHGDQQGALRRHGDAARRAAAGAKACRREACAQLADRRRSGEGHRRHHGQHDAPAAASMWQTAPEIVQRDDQRLPRQAGRRGPRRSATLQSLVSQLPTLNAPKTPFNATITRERSYAARTVSLSDAKAIAKASGAKLNDVVMAICSGALRRYLQEKGQLPGQAVDRRRADQPARARRHAAEQPGLGHAVPDRDRHRRSGGAAEGDPEVLVGGQADRRHVPRRRPAGFRLRRRADPAAAHHAGLWPQRPGRSPADADERHDLQRARPADAALLRRRQGDGAASGVDRRAWRGAQHHGAELHGRAEFRPDRRSPRGARCRASSATIWSRRQTSSRRRVVPRVETLLPRSDM